MTNPCIEEVILNCLTTDSATKEIYNHVTDIAIYLKDFGDSRHIGFLVKPDDTTLKLLHQPLHYQPLIDEAEECSTAVVLKNFAHFDDVELAALSVQLYNFVKHNADGLPYSVQYTDSPYFDEKFTYIRTEDGEGLTCATFIIESLRCIGYEIVDRSTWMPRTESNDWPRRILTSLQRRLSAYSKHFAKQPTDNVVRFRPEEIAAAAALYKADSPMCMTDAERYSNIILDNMNRTISECN